MNSDNQQSGYRSSLKYVSVSALCCFVCSLTVLVLPMIAHSATSWYASGKSHTVALTPQGFVWTLGSNEFGQLGHGSNDNVNHEPQQVRGLRKILSVSAADNHSVALREDGTVWVWGDNMSGQLATDEVAMSTTPLKVREINGAIAVAAGGSHVLALTRDGSVWSWGNNNYGQLGEGTTLHWSTPVKVAGLKDVVSVAAGAYHCLALKRDGTVWAWGYNAYGELGSPDISSKGSAVPVQVTGLANVTSISAGVNHSVALQSNNSLWVWGSNYFGQLGNGITGYGRSVPTMVRLAGQVLDVTAKQHHTVALLKDGTAMAWGDRGTRTWGTGTEMYGSVSPIKMEGFNGPVALAALVNPSTVGSQIKLADATTEKVIAASAASGNQDLSESRIMVASAELF